VNFLVATGLCQALVEPMFCLLSHLSPPLPDSNFLRTLSPRSTDQDLSVDDCLCLTIFQNSSPEGCFPPLFFLIRFFFLARRQVGPKTSILSFPRLAPLFLSSILPVPPPPFLSSWSQYRDPGRGIFWESVFVPLLFFEIFPPPFQPPFPSPSHRFLKKRSSRCCFSATRCVFPGPRG